MSDEYPKTAEQLRAQGLLKTWEWLYANDENELTKEAADTALSELLAALAAKDEEIERLRLERDDFNAELVGIHGLSSRVQGIDPQEFETAMSAVLGILNQYAALQSRLDEVTADRNRLLIEQGELLP